jgi:hypothetical protein
VGYLTGGYGAPSAAAEAAAFTLQAGQTMKDAVIKMTPQSVIAGQVTNQDGDPVERVTVRAVSATYLRGTKNMLEHGAAETDDEGRFRISGLVPGHYYLTTEQPAPLARAAPLPAYVDLPTMHPSALDFAGATLLDVTPGARMDRIDIRLRRERVFAVRGKVTLDGSPVNATVQIVLGEASSAIRTWNATATPSGFEARGIPAGRYRVEARTVGVRAGAAPAKKQPQPRTSPADASVQRGIEGELLLLRDDGPPITISAPPGLSGSAEIVIGNSNLEGVVVALGPDLELNGIFRAEDGDLQDLAKSASPPAPLTDPFEAGFMAGATYDANQGSSSSGRSSNLRPIISLVPDGGALQQMNGAAMKDDGTFRISRQGFAPGRYLWDVSNLSDSVYVKSVRYGGEDVTSSPVNVGPGGKLEIVLSGKASSITGTLRNDKNAPLSGVTVTAWPKTPNPGSQLANVKSRSTDQNGSFKIAGLAPGDYCVAAWEGGSVSPALLELPEFLASFTSEAEAVTLGEGSSANVAATLITSAKVAAAVAKLP